MNLKRFVAGVATMSAVGVGMVVRSQLVNASTWHKGTPTTLRGYYRTIASKSAGPSLPVKITKYTYQIKSSDLVWHGSTSGKYKKLKKNWYALKFVPGQGVSGIDYFKIHKINSNLLSVNNKIIGQSNHWIRYKMVRY